MAGSTFSDRLVAKGIRAPTLPDAIGVSGRRLLLILAAPVVAFGIAFAAGAATATKPAATQAGLVPSTRLVQSQIKILAVTPAPATPDLKLAPAPHAAPPRATVHPTAAVVISSPAPVIPVRPIIVPRTVVPRTVVPSTPTSTPTRPVTAPVASVPVRSNPPSGSGGSSGSTGRSGSTGGGTGTSSGGGGSGGGTGTSSGGG
jgi:uncharacterized membrane protein YgcG